MQRTTFTVTFYAFRFILQLTFVELSASELKIERTPSMKVSHSCFNNTKIQCCHCGSLGRAVAYNTIRIFDIFLLKVYSKYEQKCPILAHFEYT